MKLSPDSLPPVRTLKSFYEGLNRVQDSGINTNSVRVLLCVKLGMATKPTEIAKEIGITVSSVAAIFKKILEPKGYATKSRETDDERYVSYTLTSAGEAVLAGIVNPKPHAKA